MSVALVLDMVNNILLVVEHINFIKTIFWKLNIKSLTQVETVNWSLKYTVELE